MAKKSRPFQTLVKVVNDLVLSQWSGISTITKICSTGLSKNCRRVTFAELMSAMQRTAVSINRDLSLLAKYQLVRVYREKTPDQGIHKVIEPLFGDQKLEFRVEI